MTEQVNLEIGAEEGHASLTRQKELDFIRTSLLSRIEKLLRSELLPLELKDGIKQGLSGRT